MGTGQCKTQHRKRALFIPSYYSSYRRTEGFCQHSRSIIRLCLSYCATLIDTPSHNAKQNSQHVTEFIMSKQVYRSGTSIGANISEAQHAQSKADFLSKMTIASKEANETQYWLRLLHDNGYMNDAMFTSINKNMERILYKIIAIVKSTKENLNR